jgi:hypothetical protein
MKILRNIKVKIFFFIIFFLLIGKVNAQNKDTLAVAVLSEPMLVNNALQWDIKLHNPTDKWLRWVGGTFVFTIPGVNLNNDQYFVQYRSPTDLNAVPIPGNDLPEDAYVVQPDIVDGPCGPNDEYRGRVSVTVTGPDSLDDAVVIPMGDTIAIGRFSLVIMDELVKFPPQVPDDIMWLEPYNYYQACAYMTEENIAVSAMNPSVLKYIRANNIEMSKFGKGIVKYGRLEGPEPCYELIDFAGTYMSNLEVHLTWETNCEAHNGGYMLLRGMRFSLDQKKDQIAFTDTLGRYDELSDQSWKLQARGGYYSGQGAVYGEIGSSANPPFVDFVQYRDIEYCYKLLHYDQQLDEWITDDIICVPIPHAVITYAQGNPNPFSTESKIKFILEDDVYLTIKVIDLTGRTLKFLEFDGTEMKREFIQRTPPGTQYEVTLSSEGLASQGMYDVVFLAYPINDPVYEFSRAVVKLQMIK